MAYMNLSRILGSASASYKTMTFFNRRRVRARRKFFATSGACLTRPTHPTGRRPTGRLPPQRPVVASLRCFTIELRCELVRALEVAMTCRTARLKSLGRDITTNLPYVKEAHLAFDHQLSEH
jgi:hypothetical protein